MQNMQNTQNTGGTYDKWDAHRNPATAGNRAGPPRVQTAYMSGPPIGLKTGGATTMHLSGHRHLSPREANPITIGSKGTGSVPWSTVLRPETSSQVVNPRGRP